MANSRTHSPFFSPGLSRQRLYLVSRRSFLSCNYSSPFSSLFFSFVSVAGSNYFSAPFFSLSPTFTSFKEFSLHLQSVNLHFLSFLHDVENRLFSFKKTTQYFVNYWQCSLKICSGQLPFPLSPPPLLPKNSWEEGGCFMTLTGSCPEHIFKEHCQ